MSNATNRQALESAIALQKAGRMAEAEKLYLQVLAKQPDQADALHCLGVLYHSTGRTPAGIELVQKAIARKPTEPEYRNSLGVLLSGYADPAVVVDSFERAIALRPSYPAALMNLTNLLINIGRHERAIATSQKLVQLMPGSPEAHCALATALFSIGRLDEATAACRKALTIAPKSAQALSTLGNIFSMRGQLDEAIGAYKAAVAAQPNFAGAFSNLANALEQRGMIAEAYEAITSAVKLDPNLADAQNNYGNILKDLARLDESVIAYEKAIALRPDRSMFYSNLVYAMWFMQQANPVEILAQSRRWANILAEPLTRVAPPLPNEKSPERKLRIAYISNDFRQHPVGRLIFPLIVCRNRSQFEIVLFSGVPRGDAITQAIYQSVDKVIPTGGMSDELMAQHIRNEKIDILIDLALHMSGTRLPVFARKPAPVQITYLAYCATTGMSAMDYCITDPQLDPIPEEAQNNSVSPEPSGSAAGSLTTPKKVGIASPIHSERLLHMPRCYWCYTAPGEAPEVNASPATEAGFVTFASFNSFTKLNPEVINVWCRLMHKVPTSNLYLVVPGGAIRQTEVAADFARHGIDPKRLKMGEIVSVPAYFKMYHSADISLDPFPYNGGTTTMDSLYMGVPVVTVAGKWATARAGVTILQNFGRPDWIAASAEQYIDIAADLANDIPKLAQMRSTMRQQMMRSTLMDARRFTVDFENLYRQAWRQYCLGG
jgi:predicted O-linked N-acetylglucosamine transferase (SPINDLY family)